MAAVELSRINEILADVNLNTLSRKYPRIDRITAGGGEIVTDVYDVGLNPLFLQVDTSFDSYGDNEHITSIRFVKAVEKVITAYDPIV